jgi:hypothetical protein
MSLTNNIGCKAIVLMSALLFSQHVLAEAGRVVFAYGKVTAESPGGVIRVLNKRSHVESGDTIRTANKSLVQMRMIDKAFIALRPNTAFKIEEYNLGAKKDEDVGFFALLKGGFRAVTGIIGKRLRSSYRMRTVTATIGIRGTDYTARLCAQDCNQAFGNIDDNNRIDDGLYVGVNEGGVSLTNNLGSLSLDQLQFGYVRDATTAPVALAGAPEFLYFNSRPPNPDDDQASTGEADNVAAPIISSRSEVVPARADLTTDDSIKAGLKLDTIELAPQQIEQNSVIDQVATTENGSEISLVEGAISSSRMVAISTSSVDGSQSLAAVHSNPYTVADITASNDLQGFENRSLLDTTSTAAYSTGEPSIDLGYDPTTGIAWGRWGAGMAQLQDSNAEFSSLHWVTSPDQAQNIALPSSGTVEYQWSGNTTPTDNLGNSGILGNAALSADFTNMNVDVDVDVGINNQVWNGSASNLPITSNGGFSGDLSTVTVNTGAATIDGSGGAAGFFTNNANGAGFGFSMNADVQGTATSVNGTAIFQKP